MKEQLTAWEVVQIARNPKRPTSKYIIQNVFDNFLEMHGDKLFADDAAIIGGIGMLDGVPVTVIGIFAGAPARGTSFHRIHRGRDVISVGSRRARYAA